MKLNSYQANWLSGERQSCFPGELEQKVCEFVQYYYSIRYQESLRKLTPEGIRLGGGEKTLEQLRKIKQKAISPRIELHLERKLVS